jgi:hypothetical protein
LSEEQKPSLDERLKAIAHKLELLKADLAQWQEEQKRLEKRLDRRERKAREALRSGIAAYLRALGEEG